MTRSARSNVARTPLSAGRRSTEAATVKRSTRANTGISATSPTPSPDLELGRLVGYHARRASLVLVESFTRSMQSLAPRATDATQTAPTLRPVEFSVLCVIAAQPGMTARKVCATLSLLPPNLVKLLVRLEQQGWIERKPHPKDRRATGLFATNSGLTLVETALEAAERAEKLQLAALSETEQQTLIQLLQKVYR